MKNSDRQQDRPVAAGHSYPLGPTVHPEGVNFSIYCKHGSLVSLLFFDHVNDLEPSREIALNNEHNRTYHYWHVFVSGVRAGQLYGYRIHGPFDPSTGQRYDPDKILLDPYAKVVATPPEFKRKGFATPGKAKSPSMKSVVADLSLYDWKGDERLQHPFSKTIIYEMHVGGFTKHGSSNINSSKKGKFSGVMEKIPYLVDLGITAVELLPIFEFDEQDAPEGLPNYWGYSPVSFFAAHQGYSSSNQPLDILDEFRDMVRAFHDAGIEVILDVVYNHTAEGDAKGPTYHFRGIDNSLYYLLEKNGNAYANYSGCGNTLNANQSVVRRLIIDSLHFWVKEMHVDGFRFDLASILSRDENGHPLSNPPILWDIESDPVLSGVKLIAEAWDAAGLYQLGTFVGDSWKEWNGKFRDDVRKFLRGDCGVLSHMVTRLVGSPDIFGHEEREAEQSINFVTCHDGFTLNDLVSYDKKNNEANNEANRDGCSDNYSWNCGVEGPSDDPLTEKLRNRQVKNFFAVTLLAIGAPMISMGDELRRTQRGNNNAYCQDNEISWFDWSLQEKHNDVFRFVKFLIQARLSRDASQLKFKMSLNELLETGEIIWHGVKLNQPDWSHHSSSIAFTVKSLSGEMDTHFLINAFREPLRFELPILDGDQQWRKWIDTSLESPNDICHWNEASPVNGNEYHVEAYTIAALINLRRP